MTRESLPEVLTIKGACKVVGGDRPIDPSTYYRGVARGIFPAPFHPSPGIARVETAKLLAAIDAQRDGEAV
jgi:hypothetical protein